MGPSAPIQAVALKPLPVVPDAALLELEPPFSANICKLCWNEEKACCAADRFPDWRS